MWDNTFHKLYIYTEVTVTVLGLMSVPLFFRSLALSNIPRRCFNITQAKKLNINMAAIWL